MERRKKTMNITQEDQAYNQRQLLIMQATIEAFRDRKIGIGKLVSDLDALAACLRNADESWKKAFASNWGTLEDIHASLLERKEKKMEGRDAETFATALEEIASIILSKISK
jgi:hypothetical protein